MVDQGASHATLILLGSRSGEGWLAPNTFEEQVYELGGLDPEAASILVDLILKRHHIEHYRKDPNVQRLIQLLDGFPLALEVVFANLTQQSPKQVLDALQAGGVDLNPGTSQEKTENILRCIDYSHSNLSPGAQQLLSCLAPFTSVVFENVLERYTHFLQQQSSLASLPFDQWTQVVQEVSNWGLLLPDSQLPGVLRLQPTLPYFLRHRLNAPEQQEKRLAIESAFQQLYDEYSHAINALLQSKEPQEQQLGLVMTHLEYENLVTTLTIALSHRHSILSPYITLL